MRRLINIGCLSLVVGLLPNRAMAMFYDPTNGYYYERVDAVGTWYQQWASVSQLTIDPQGTTLYGRLAVISDQEVENDMFSVLPEGASPNLAIGLYDPTDTGNFQWIDGTAITYGGPNTSDPTSPYNFPEGPNGYGGEWEYGQPSLVSGEDYVAFSISTAPWGGSPFWAWNTFGASDELDGAVVEFTPTPDYVPEPSSLVVLGAFGFLLVRRRSPKLSA
jgi:hypothetical protein